MLRSYYRLTKPGIIYGNAITAIAGFFLAAKGHIVGSAFIGMLLGLSLVIASGCVFNNYIDRTIDAKMKRTKNRALVTGLISGRSALLYATTLGVLGVVLLVTLTNVLTAAIALFGLFAYVVLYGLAKRYTVYGTVVGSISGAVPPIVGYCAVSNRFDTEALLLFLMLIFWQMPHFYAIAIQCLDDYKAAGIPVLPAVKNGYETKLQSLFYIGAFTVTALAMSVLGYTGPAYFVVTGAVCVLWFWQSAKGFSAANDKQWAHKTFRYSLIVLITISLMLSIDSLLA